MILPRTISLSVIEAIQTSAYQAREKAGTPGQQKSILRDIAVLELLFATGVRVSELCALRCGDVRLEEKDAMEQANTFFVNRFRKPLSTQSVRAIVNKYCKLAGIKDHITPHMFRHTYAVMAIQSGDDIKTVQENLDHATASIRSISVPGQNPGQAKYGCLSGWPPEPGSAEDTRAYPLRRISGALEK